MLLFINDALILRIFVILCKKCEFPVSYLLFMLVISLASGKFLTDKKYLLTHSWHKYYSQDSSLQTVDLWTSVWNLREPV